MFSLKYLLLIICIMPYLSTLVKRLFLPSTASSGQKGWCTFRIDALWRIVSTLSKKRNYSLNQWKNIVVEIIIFIQKPFWFSSFKLLCSPKSPFLVDDNWKSMFLYWNPGIIWLLKQECSQFIQRPDNWLRYIAYHLFWFTCYIWSINI